MPLTTYTSGEVLTAASLNANFTFAASNPLGGLVLTGSASPSAASSVSINNCFTSAYENYRIIGAFTNASGTGSITARLRAASTDTTTNYTGQITESYTSSVATTLNPSGTDDWYITDVNATYPIPSFSFDVYRPQTAQKTTFTGLNIYQNTGALLVSQYAAGIQTSTTQFDGITILSSVNITGTIRVYGYTNS